MELYIIEKLYPKENWTWKQVASPHTLSDVAICLEMLIDDKNRFRVLEVVNSETVLLEFISSKYHLEYFKTKYLIDHKIKPFEKYYQRRK